MRKLIDNIESEHTDEQEVRLSKEVGIGNPLDESTEREIDSALDGLEGEDERLRRQHEAQQRALLAARIEKTKMLMDGRTRTPTVIITDHEIGQALAGEPTPSGSNIKK